MSIRTKSKNRLAVLLAVTLLFDQVVAREFTEIDLQHWFQFDRPYDSPLDLSYLNHRPAGKHGFVRAIDDELEFVDGTKVRFWGTNLYGKALFQTSFIDIPKQAQRIAALGFNLVRIHHHDSVWVNPNVFGKNAGSTAQIDGHYMSYLDKWIAELNKQGVYVWFDLHVERFVTREDNISAFDEIDRKWPKYEGRANIKGYSYVNRSIQNAMKSINQQYLTRINRFTDQAYADNPGIAFLQLTNENDVTHHFGNKLLPSQNVPEHTRIYLAAAKAFAERWDFPPDNVWKSWIPGASKLFLNDLEHRFNIDLLASLRKYDRNHLISTTSSWGTNPLSSLPSLTDGDFIDVHTYGETGELRHDPRDRPNFLHWIAAAHLADKPLSVSEWNLIDYPVDDRHLSPLLMAGMASHQGWDTIVQFAYGGEPPIAAGRAHNWAMYNDPALLGTMPAAALMFRGDHVQQARRKYILVPDNNLLMHSTLSPKTSIALRTIPEVSRLQIALSPIKQLPWMKPTHLASDALIIRNTNFSPLLDNASSATSDTGELIRDWGQGTYSIDTVRSKSISGQIGGKKLSLGEVEFAIETPNASIVVQALDDLPLATSRNMLISLGARAVPQHPGKAPLLAEPVTGRIKITGLPGLKLYRKRFLSGFSEVPMSFSSNVYTIDLTPALSTYWLFLRDTPPPGPQ